MSDVVSPHDRYFRETFSRPATVQGFVGEYLPAEVVGRLDLRTLKVTDCSYVAPELRLHVSGGYLPPEVVGWTPPSRSASGATPRDATHGRGKARSPT